MSDPHDLARFVTAQDRDGTYDAAVAGTACRAQGDRTGCGSCFRRLRGLGSSHLADLYGIGSRDEATAYLAHEVLGPRLHRCAQLVTKSGAATADGVDGLRGRTQAAVVDDVVRRGRRGRPRTSSRCSTVTTTANGIPGPSSCLVFASVRIVGSRIRLRRCRPGYPCWTARRPCLGAWTDRRVSACASERWDCVEGGVFGCGAVLLAFVVDAVGAVLGRVLCGAASSARRCAPVAVRWSAATGAVGAQSSGNSSRLPGVVVWVRPSGAVHRTVPSGCCRSRQPVCAAPERFQQVVNSA